MMRRLILGIGLLAGLVFSPAHVQGQRGPTLSDDVKQALARGERVRVIVQAEEDTLQSLRTRHGRGLRRLLAGALSLDLTPQDARALRFDGSIAHISGDLPVVADNSTSTRSRAPRRSGRERAACWGCSRRRATPARASASPSSIRASPIIRPSPIASSLA